MKNPDTNPDFYRHLFQESPVAQLVYEGEDMVPTQVNKAMLQIFGRPRESILGRPIMEAIPELQNTPLLQQYRAVLHTGQPHHEQAAQIALFKNGQSHRGYYDYTYKPVFDESGKPICVICTTVEVSDRVTAERKLQDSEAFARDIITHSPIAKIVFTGEDMHINTVNERMLQILHRDKSIIGMPFVDALPELRVTPLLDRLRAVLHTGKTYLQPEEAIDLIKDGTLQTGYYNYIYKALQNATGQIWGVMCTAQEITAQVMARRQAQTGETRLRRLMEEMPIASCLFTGPHMVVEVANKTMLGYWGKGNAPLGRPFIETLPELKNQGFIALLENVYQTGETYAATDVEAQLEVDGVLGSYFFDFTYQALRDEQGAIYGVLDTAIDVTEKVLARRQKEAAERRLLHAIEMAELGTWNLDVATGFFTCSERVQEWLSIGEMYLNLDASIREEEAILPQPVLDLKAALQPGHSGFFDHTYTLANTQTGRKHIIRANGQVLTDSEGKVLSIAGTAQDITIQQEQQNALEGEVQERTEELAAAVEELRATNEELAEANTQLLHSNEELAQYAYVASHDLQEPLRKIRIFTDMVGNSAGLPSETKTTIDKISQSAERMSLLIQDLLSFSRLLKSDRLVRPIDLGQIVEAVWSDYELKTGELGATLNMGELPRIEGVNLQINQLFYNLMGNALKFVRPGAVPRITVSSEEATAAFVKEKVEQPLPATSYFHIQFEDNGIGFDTEYAEQIFEVFKRLHGRDMYPGSGIGLALCRRIVANHHGALWAESVVEQGTTFHILLPAKQHQTESEFGTAFDFPRL